MILVGQYDSPYVRRVAVSLRLLGIAYEHAPLSVFADAAAMQAYNPLGRVPTLVLDSGEPIVDSGAILDWLDETVGPDRALLPPRGEARRRALQIVALATGAADKAIQLAYEERLRPPEQRWPAWVERCRGQIGRALAALEGIEPSPWLGGERIGQADVTTACLWRYLQLAVADLPEPQRFPNLAGLAARCEELPAFRATWPDAYVVPSPT